MTGGQQEIRMWWKRERMRRGVGARDEGGVGKGCSREGLDVKGRCRTRKGEAMLKWNMKDGGWWRGCRGLVAKNARPTRRRARREPTNATLPGEIDPPPACLNRHSRCKMCGRRPPLRLFYAWGAVAQPRRCTRAASGAADERQKSPSAEGSGRDQRSPIDSVCEHAGSPEMRQQLQAARNQEGRVQSTAKLSRERTNKRSGSPRQQFVVFARIPT